MSALRVVFARELRAYFATPLAAVFLVVFLFLAGLFTFSVGNLYQRGQADLRPFFQFVPWMFLFLAPAVSMRLWAEERRLGTIEGLATLPLPLWQVVSAKFLAAWAFCGIALALTLPLWLTVNWLGDPDQGAIVAGYLASLLLAGAYLAVGSVLSACTKNQVVAFVLTVVACFLLLLAGFPLVLDFVQGWVPEGVRDALAGISVLSHFESISRGVIDLRDIIYFVALIAAMLVANTLLIDWRKAA